MDFCISGEELKKALKDIRIAEKNGFKCCLSVFKLIQCGWSITECRAAYSDIVEQASWDDGSLQWGRHQGVTKRFKFKNNKLVLIKEKNIKVNAKKGDVCKRQTRRV